MTGTSAAGLTGNDDTSTHHDWKQFTLTQTKKVQTELFIWPVVDVNGLQEEAAVILVQGQMKLIHSFSHDWTIHSSLYYCQ